MAVSETGQLDLVEIGLSALRLIRQSDVRT